MKLWQEDADMFSVLNNRLNKGLFCLEILLLLHSHIGAAVGKQPTLFISSLDSSFLATV